jgi:hypothetical protein
MAYNVTAQLNLQLNPQSINQIVQALNSMTNGRSIGGNLFNVSKIKDVTNELNNSKNAMMQFGEQSGLAAKRFGAFTLVAGSLVQVTQGFRTMLNEAVAFDREMVKLKQVSSDTAGSGVAAIREEIDKLSTGLGVSSSQLARVSVVLKQANLSLGETKTALEALALSALAPNFDSMEKTAEGAIAVLKQFKIPVEELKSALGSINAVAGEFAVEASDLIGVVQRTGGAFKAAGGNLNELLALFTSVRQTTRESAESISTGLRTIFTRIQRTGTAEALREVGVNLRYTRDEALALGNVNLTSQFVGAYEAVRRLSVALNQIPSTSPKFAQLVEELGGYRQISKVIPLIQEFEISQNALNVAITGGSSLMNSAAQAQGSFGNRLDKLKESYLQFGRSITDTSSFKTLFTAFETGAKSALVLLEAIKPLIPMLTVLATMKVAQSIGSFGAGFVKGVAPAKKSSGGLLHFKRGGIVPGSGHGDIVPAMLEPGEMVIPKRMVKKYSFGGPHTADIDESTLNNPTGFSSYMQGSQTVNPKTGKYRKFFHGTKGQNFDNFSNAHAKNTWFGRGHYFSADAKVASRYSETDKTAGGYDPGARVMSATLQMKNPYTWNSDKSLKDFMTKGGKKIKSINGQFDQKDWNEIVKKGVLPEDISQGTLDHLNKIFTKFPSIAKKWNQAYSEKIDKDGNKIIKGMSPESKMKFVAHGATQTLKKQGYDSVNVDYGLGKDYFNASTVFHPKQIKSLGNEGGWDPSLKEIGKNLGGLIQKFAIGGDVDESKINNPEGFRAFMKGSKTLNAETGKYKKFFHGTRGDNFNTFNNSKTGGNFYGKAHYFTQDYDSASSYSGQDTVRNIGSRVLPTTLQMKNPYSWDEDKSINDLVTAGEALKARNGKLDRRTWNERIEMGAFPEDISEDTLNHANKIFTRFPSIAQAFNKMDTAQQRKFFSHVASKALQKQGFDSINIGSDYSAVFKSNQIKSLYNTGTWDSKNTDIMKNLGGYIERKRFMAGSPGGVQQIAPPVPSKSITKGRALRSISNLENIASNTKILNGNEKEIFPAKYQFKAPINMVKLYISPQQKAGLAKGGRGWEQYIAQTLNYTLMNSEDAKFPYDLKKSEGHYADAKDMDYNSAMVIEGRKKALNMLLLNNFGKYGYRYSDIKKQTIQLPKNQLSAQLNNTELTVGGTGIITANESDLIFPTTNPNPSFQKKASGGFIVPGVGDTDSVPMDLPVGSYVIKKSSTKKMGFANGGVVPAILTPGELVIDPKTASGIGRAKLDHMNRTGRSAFGKGGRVGFAVGGGASSSGSANTPEQNKALSNLLNQLPTLYKDLIDDLTKITFSLDESVSLEQNRNINVMRVASIYEQQMRLSLQQEELLKEGNKAEADKVKLQLEASKLETAKLMEGTSKSIQRGELKSGDKTIPIKYKNDTIEQALRNEDEKAAKKSQPSSVPAPKPPTGPAPSAPPPPPNRPTPTTPPTSPAPAPAPTPAPTPQPPTPTTPPTGPAPTPPKPPTGPTPSSPSNKPPLGVPPPTPPKPSIDPSNLISKLTRVRANKALDDAGVNLKDTGNITQQVKLMEMQKQRAQIEKEYIKHTMLQIKASMPHLKSSERLTLAQGMFADAMKNGTIAVNTRTNKVEGDTRLGGNGAQLMADKKAAQQAAKQPPPKESLLKRGINYLTTMPSENRMMMATMAGGMAASYGSEFFDQNAGTANDAVKNNTVGSYSLSKGAAGGLQGAAMAGSIAMSMGATPLVGAIAAVGVGVVSAIGSYIAANKQALEEVANTNQEKLTALTTKMMEKQNSADLSSLNDSVSQLSTSAANAASASTGILESLGLGGSFLGGRSEQKKRQDSVGAAEKAQQQNAPQISNVLTKNLSQQLIKSGVVNKTEADFYKLSNTIITQSAEFQTLIMSARQTGESFEEARVRITKAASGIAQMEAVKQANLKMQDMINRSADHLKTFADNLEGASVRIGESFRNFDNAISAFEGGNRINKGYDLEKNAKIFANPSAFSSGEFETAITSTFSNFPSEIGANIAQQYAPMADISNRLPEVLAQSIYAENPVEDFMSRMEAVLGDTAKDPQVKAILAGLANKLTDKDNIKSKGASALATEMSSSILDPIKAYGSKINELNNQITESLISSFTKLNQSTLKLIEGYEKADQLLFNALETQAKAQNIMMGGSGDTGAKPMAVAQLQAIQQKRYLDEAKRPELLGNTAGIGEALRTAMDNLNEIQQLPEEAFAGQDRSRAEVLAGFDKEIDSFKKALEHTITGQLAVAAEFGKLAQEVGKQRNAGASLSKRLAMGGPEEQLKFMQGSKIFQSVMSGQISAGQVLNNPMLAKMLDEFAQMTGEMKINGLTAQEHLNARIYEPHAQMAFGVPGRDVEANLVNQQALHEAEAAKAQEQLNKSMQQSIENGNQKLIDSQAALKQALDEVKMTEMIKLEQQKTVASPEMAKQQQAVNTIKSLNQNNALNEQDLESLKDPSTRDKILKIKNLQNKTAGYQKLSEFDLNQYAYGKKKEAYTIDTGRATRTSYKIVNSGIASSEQANDTGTHNATIGQIQNLLGGGNANNSILSPDEISEVIKKSFTLKIPLNEVVKQMIDEKQGLLNQETHGQGGQNALRLTNTLNANPEFAQDFEGNLTKLSEAMANLGTTSFKKAAESVEKFAAIVKESTDNIEKMKKELKIMRENGKGVADTDKDKAAVGREGVVIQNQENAARQMAQQQAEAAKGGVVGKANGGLIYKAVGGSIFKPQGTDTVPAMLTPGEFVMKKSAVDKIGALKLSQMNNNSSYFDDGGPVQNNINPPLNKDEKQFLDKLKNKTLEQMMIEKYGMNKDQFRKKYGTIYKTPIFADNFINPDSTKGIEQLDPNAGFNPRHIRPEDFDWDTGARISDEDVKFAEAFGKMRGHYTLGELKQIAAYYGADAVYAEKLYPQYRLDPKHLFENKITHNMANMLYLSPQERAQIAESNQDENTYASKKYDRYKNQEMDKMRGKYGITKEEFDERYPAPKNENEKPKREMTTNEFNAIFGENLSPEEKDKIYQLYGDMAVPKNEVDIGKGTFNGKPSLAAQRQRYQKERQYAWFREHDEDRDKASGPSPYVGGHQNEMRPSLYDQRFGNNNNNNNKMQPNLHDQRFGNNNNNRVIDIDTSNKDSAKAKPIINRIDIPEGQIPKAKPIINPVIDINTGGKLSDEEQSQRLINRNRNFFAGQNNAHRIGDIENITLEDVTKNPAPKIIDPLQSAYKKALNNYHVDYSYKNKKGEKVTLFGDTHRTALENKYNKHQEELEKLKNKIRTDLPNRNAEPPDPNNWFVKNKIPRDKALDVNEMMERNFLKWDLAAKIYTEIQVLDKAFANPKLLNNAEKLHLRRYIISLQRKHFALMNDPREINNTFMNKSNANWNENNFGFEPVVPPLLPQGIPVIGRRSNYKPPEIQNKMNGGLIKPSYYEEGGPVHPALNRHQASLHDAMQRESGNNPFATTPLFAGNESLNLQLPSGSSFKPENKSQQIPKNNNLNDIWYEMTQMLDFRNDKKNIKVVKRANGGSIFKPQGTDTIPAMLTPGEFVMRKAAVDKIGVTKLSQMNNNASYFANGGMVNGSSSLDQSTSFNQVAASFNGFIASFNVSVETFNNSIQIFGDKVNDFANAVSVIPSTLTVNGEVGASVVTNTAGIVTQISNVVQNMIASEIKKALNNNTSLDQKSRPS